MGETREIAAKISCFRNHQTYSHAKVVLKHGLAEVIRAMDDGLTYEKRIHQKLGARNRVHAFYTSIYSGYLKVGK